jgi:hypothetical protein
MLVGVRGLQYGYFPGGPNSSISSNNVSSRLYCLWVSFLAQKLNIYWHMLKTYFPTSWFRPQSELCVRPEVITWSMLGWARHTWLRAEMGAALAGRTKPKYSVGPNPAAEHIVHTSRCCHQQIIKLQTNHCHSPQEPMLPDNPKCIIRQISSPKKCWWWD